MSRCAHCEHDPAEHAWGTCRTTILPLTSHGPGNTCRCPGYESKEPRSV